MEPLRDDEVHIWLTSPDTVEDLAPLEALLSPEELTAAHRFKFERDQRLYTVAHAFVRTTLSRFAPVAPTEWSFTKNSYGRPEIANDVRLRFNLSHTNGLIACLVTPSADAGVDVERRRAVTDVLSIARHFFSKAEQDDLLRQPEEHRHDRFFALWTLKESYIKARGMGLALSLSGFSFSFDDGQIRLEVDPKLNDDGRAWQFGLTNPTSDHRLAWAIRNNGRPFEVRIRPPKPFFAVPR